MRIDDWPLERIMRLPDWCFGQRWPVGLYATKTGAGSAWDISEIALPEVSVLWEFTFWPLEIMAQTTNFRLALGQQLPVATAQMDQLEPLLAGVGIQGPTPRQIIGQGYAAPAIRMLRKPIESGGKKVILELTTGGAAAQDLQVILVFSSIPREVPDWLFSAQVINLP